MLHIVGSALTIAVSSFLFAGVAAAAVTGADCERVCWCCVRVCQLLTSLRAREYDEGTWQRVRQIVRQISYLPRQIVFA